MQSFNPYFVAYAKAHGNTPESMLESDERRYPGGIMCGFICWMSEQHREFYKSHREAFLSPDRIADHAAWGKWLESAFLRKQQQA